MELDHLLGKLKMDHLEAQLDAVCEQAARRQADYKTFLVQALQTEWQGRYQRGTELRLRQARFPWLKTLEQFDFEFQPSLDRRQVRELAGMSFVERAHNVIVLGPPGVGKTHLAIALGIKAVEAGYSVLFLTLEELIGRLVRAAKESRLERSLQQLTYPKVLIIDEIGYLPLSSFEASLFFRLVVRRYERASMIITSNKSFLDWGEVFPGLVRQDRQRPGAGHGHPGSPAALLHHAQHQGGELPAQGEAAGRPAGRSRRCRARREGGGSPALTIGSGHDPR